MKSKRSVFVACGAAVAGILAGCGLGYNRMLFFSTTNYGLDTDTTPPTAEVSIGRREGVIAPSFDGDKVPAVLGVFHSEGNFFNPALSSAFAGGKAASLVTKAKDDKTDDVRSCATYPPRSKILESFSRSFLGALTETNDTARPFFFATDTMTGLKAVWSGATDAIPQTVKLGYNRKEFAYAPVFAAPVRPTPTGSAAPAESGSPTPSFCPPGQVEVTTPSFLATLFSGININLFTNSGLRYAQTFATGTAAEHLAQRDDFRQVLTRQMLPTEVVGVSATPSQTPQATPTATAAGTP